MCKQYGYTVALGIADCCPHGQVVSNWVRYSEYVIDSVSTGLFLLYIDRCATPPCSIYSLLARVTSSIVRDMIHECEPHHHFAFH
jgi:hypothetical protein